MSDPNHRYQGEVVRSDDDPSSGHHAPSVHPRSSTRRNPLQSSHKKFGSIPKIPRAEGCFQPYPQRSVWGCMGWTWMTWIVQLDGGTRQFRTDQLHRDVGSQRIERCVCMTVVWEEKPMRSFRHVDRPEAAAPRCVPHQGTPSMKPKLSSC